MDLFVTWILFHTFDIVSKPLQVRFIIAGCIFKATHLLPQQTLSIITEKFITTITKRNIVLSWNFNISWLDILKQSNVFYGKGGLKRPCSLTGPPQPQNLCTITTARTVEEVPLQLRIANCLIGCLHGDSLNVTSASAINCHIGYSILWIYFSQKNDESWARKNIWYISYIKVCKHNDTFRS